MSISFLNILTLLAPTQSADNLVVFSIVPPIVYCASSFPCPVWRHLHFPKLNSICHFSDHSVNLLISSCQCCLSASLLIFLNTFVSSANFNTLLVMSSSKLLMYIKNKIGPNTDPCGTPLKPISSLKPPHQLLLFVLYQ